MLLECQPGFRELHVVPAEFNVITLLYMAAPAYMPARAAVANSVQKVVWVYNGSIVVHGWPQAAVAEAVAADQDIIFLVAAMFLVAAASAVLADVQVTDS